MVNRFINQEQIGIFKITNHYLNRNFELNQNGLNHVYRKYRDFPICSSMSKIKRAFSENDKYVWYFRKHRGSVIKSLIFECLVLWRLGGARLETRSKLHLWRLFSQLSSCPRNSFCHNILGKSKSGLGKLGFRYFSTSN